MLATDVRINQPPPLSSLTQQQNVSQPWPPRAHDARTQTQTVIAGPPAGFCVRVKFCGYCSSDDRARGTLGTWNPGTLEPCCRRTSDEPDLTLGCGTYWPSRTGPEQACWQQTISVSGRTTDALPPAPGMEIMCRHPCLAVRPKIESVSHQSSHEIHHPGAAVRKLPEHPCPPPCTGLPPCLLQAPALSNKEACTACIAPFPTKKKGPRKSRETQSLFHC
ncbi:hypothetical protein B0H66DRAFT_239730 [Apodospora peruviana]|uniref:Uncharacterized protein n=1 Tax=Apodospora peruviana TaxID=516989 RepID=A0AAE0M434_9PEZI|nr:hypothetical protein B0H66DRAFT_239730 [Apodospora peruviana]